MWPRETGVGTPSVEKVMALFNARRQSTNFVVRRTETGSFTASGTFRCTRDKGFPGVEVIEREGMLYRPVRALLEKLETICGRSWYHHYLPADSKRYPQPCSPTNWWSVRVAFSDGTIKRWEGINITPPEMDEIYHEFVQMGMPELKLENGGSYAQECGYQPSPRELQRLSCYDRLLREAKELEADDETREEVALVVGEFLDDIEHYLYVNLQDYPLDTALDVWKVEPELEALRAIDVRKAPRMQMLSLYAALTCTSDPRSLILGLLESGTLRAWGDRLGKLPYEELLETRRTDDELHKAKGAAADKEVRRLIEEGGVFTARDVAKEVGCTTQHASARIRAFLKRGDLKMVGEEMPRQYQAA